MFSLKIEKKNQVFQCNYSEMKDFFLLPANFGTFLKFCSISFKNDWQVNKGFLNLEYTGKPTNITSARKIFTKFVGNHGRYCYWIDILFLWL